MVKIRESFKGISPAEVDKIQLRFWGITNRCNNQEPYRTLGIKNEFGGTANYIEFFSKECKRLGYSISEGIKFLVTDRINPLGNYNAQNCRLIERPINDIRQRSKGRVIKWFGKKFIYAWEFERALLPNNEAGLSKEIRKMESGKEKRTPFEISVRISQKEILKSLNDFWQYQDASARFFKWLDSKGVKFFYYDFNKEPLRLCKPLCPECKREDLRVNRIKSSGVFILRCERCGFFFNTSNKGKFRSAVLYNLKLKPVLLKDMLKLNRKNYNFLENYLTNLK